MHPVEDGQVANLQTTTLKTVNRIKNNSGTNRYPPWSKPTQRRFDMVAALLTCSLFLLSCDGVEQAGTTTVSTIDTLLSIFDGKTVSSTDNLPPKAATQHVDSLKIPGRKMRQMAVAPIRADARLPRNAMSPNGISHLP